MDRERYCVQRMTRNVRCGVKSAGLTLCQPLPVYPEERTSTDRHDWSGSCPIGDIALSIFEELERPS
jgi:hypothetical protein